VILLGSYPAYSDHNTDHLVENLKGGLGALEQRVWDCEHGVNGACPGSIGPQGMKGDPGMKGEPGMQGMKGDQGIQGEQGDNQPLNSLATYLSNQSFINTFSVDSFNAMSCSSGTGGEISVQIGEETYVGIGFIGREGISRVSSYSVVFQANHAVDAAGIIGQSVNVVVISNALTSTFNGEVTASGQVAVESGYPIYGIKFKPPIYRINRSRGYQFWQDQSVVDIFASVLDLAGVDYIKETTDEPLPHEYTVQYNESDLNFITRILEEEGIFYYFNGSGEVIVRDNANSNISAGSVIYNGHLAPMTSGVAQLLTLREEIKKPGGNFSFGSYALLTPGTDLFETASNVGGIGNAFEFERELSSSVILNRAKINRDRSNAKAHMSSGTGNTPKFRAGYQFQVAGNTHLLTRVKHVALLDTEKSCVTYMNDFDATTSISNYHPSRKTPKPVVGGVSTGVVIGPAGQTIHTDGLGRVKVKFPWLRDGDTDVWLRVSQAHTHTDEIFIPKIGEEVVIGFLEGDPSKPIVLGVIYNGNNLPPVPLP